MLPFGCACVVASWMDLYATPDFGGRRTGARPSAFAAAVERSGQNGLGAARSRTTARRTGGARQAVRGGTQYDTRWKGGAEVADAIARCGDRVTTIVPRTSPGTHRGPIDHIVVTPSGVFVVRAARFTGKVEVDEQPLQRPKLLVGGVDRTDLVEDLHRHAGLVVGALGPLAVDVPVRLMLGVATPKGILADSVLPTIRPLSIGVCPLLTPARLAKRLVEPGPLGPLERTRIARVLAQRLPAAAR